MINNSVRVAVIDSGVDGKYLSDYSNISNYYLKDGVWEECNGDTNGHGSDVVGILLKEKSDIDVVSLQILNHENKAKVSELISALKHCIALSVNVINVSLGFSGQEMEVIQELHDVCKMVKAHGIFIFAANHNEGLSSYPADFDEVISVGGNIESDVTEVDIKRRHIELYNICVMLEENKAYKVVRGNSYLSPLVAGTFCAYLESINKPGTVRSVEEKFLLLVNEVLHQGTLPFIYKISWFRDLKRIEKRVLVVTAGAESDLGLIHALNQNGFCVEVINIKEVNLDKSETYDVAIEECDVAIFGLLTKEEAAVIRIIDCLCLYQKSVMFVAPIMSAECRYKMIRDYGIDVSCVYL